MRYALFMRRLLRKGPTRRAVKIKTALGVVLILTLLTTICTITYVDLKLRPVVVGAAKSRARLFAAGIVSESVDGALKDVDSPLVNVIYGTEGISAIETNIAGITRLRADSIESISEKLSNPEKMTLEIPVGNLAGGIVFTGRGFPVKIRLVPIGDVSSEIYSEFSETGINQTLHRIYLRVRVVMNMIVASDITKLELSSDVLLSETVIVGKVPDAYTAINRFEIDENEENDLNDYAAQLP